ncbi:hypothetical protein LY78DRAFT_742157 [Colletotrichum sublineola]|nr:hypothetical protein LY78DRAFT_742157 [Colletotrichum sublineola]
MHIDECKQWLRTINGCTHIGVRSVQVFHSYKANLWRVTAWLVENTDKNRKILDDSTCGEDTVWLERRLFNDDYMGSRALELLLSGYQTPTERRYESCHRGESPLEGNTAYSMGPRNLRHQLSDPSSRLLLLHMGTLVLIFLIVADQAVISASGATEYHIRPYPLENSGSRPLSHR